MSIRLRRDALMWGTLAKPRKSRDGAKLLSLHQTSTCFLTLTMDDLSGASDTPPSLAEVTALAASIHAKRQKYVPILLSQHPTKLTENDSTVLLRKEYETAFRDDIKTSSHILDLLSRRAAADCRHLTELMYRKLPADLRQIVYRFLCIEDQPIPVGPYYHFRTFRVPLNSVSSDHLAAALSVGRDRVDHTARPDPDILMPDSHIFKPSYVSNDIACEIREAYFSNNTFSICNVDGGIFDFVYGNITDTSTLSPPDRDYPGARVPTFRVDMFDNLPAFKFANKLQLRLKYEHECATIIKDVPISPLAHRETFANECSFLRSSKNSLSALHCIQAGHETLDIEIIIMTALGYGEGAKRHFINILQSLRNTIYALKYDRLDSIVKVIHHDENVSPFPRDITALWSLTKEQWNQVSVPVPYLTISTMTLAISSWTSLTFQQEKRANEDEHGSTWDADFYLAPLELDGLAQEAHGGILEDETAHLLRERWGITNALKDTRPKWPIKEGKYWPIRKGAPGWW